MAKGRVSGRDGDLSMAQLGSESLGVNVCWTDGMTVKPLPWESFMGCTAMRLVPVSIRQISPKVY